MNLELANFRHCERKFFFYRDNLLLVIYQQLVIYVYINIFIYGCKK